jgi:hypothetical protein
MHRSTAPGPSTRLFIVVSLISSSAALPVLVNNSAPRLTRAGGIVDSHNGGLVIAFDGAYHLYGISFGGCVEQTEGCTNSSVGACGFGTNTTISVYSSANLEQTSWELEREDILPIPAGPLRGTVSRPSLVHCARTGDWLLWWNFANASSGGQFALAVAAGPTPLGPFAVVAAPVAMPHSFIGDFTVFIDDDNETAWVYYTTWAPGTLGELFLAKLDPTFTHLASPALTYGPLFDGLGLVESPIVWKEGAEYFFLTGHGCCFCEEGSGVYVFTAPALSGPYTPHGNIGCNYSEPAPHVSVASHGCLLLGTCYTSTLQAELAYSFTLASGQRVLVFDRWQHAPDRLKGHDPELWLPVQYSSDGGLAPLRFVEAWTLDVPPVPP